MSDTKRAVQPQTMARGLKIADLGNRGIYEAKHKALIGCIVIAQLI